MLGALVSAGASLIGGLFGRSSAKKKAKEEKAAIADANRAAAQQAEAANQRAAEAALATRQRSTAATEAANAGLLAASQASERALMTAAKVPVVTKVVDDDTETTSSRTTGNVNMQAFMNAAESYGFNPLTFLRSGALSLFATQNTTTGRHTYRKTTTSVTGDKAVEAAAAAGELRVDAAQAAGSNLMQNATAGDVFLGSGVTANPQPLISNTNVPGVGEIFGNAITNGANQWLADRSAQENRQFQLDLQNAQLQGSQRHGSASQRPLGSTPTTVTSGGTVTGKGSGALSPKSGQLCIDGVGCLYANPGTTPAQNISDRTGEAGEWIGGVFVGISDAEYTLRQNAAKILGVPPASVTYPQMLWANEKKANTPLAKGAAAAYDVIKNPMGAYNKLLDWGWNYGQ